MNVGSVYQFGAFVSDDDIGGITGNTFAVVTEGDLSDMSGGQDSLESALAIVNQSAEDFSATIDFELNADLSSDTEYVFELQSSRDGSDTREGLSTSPITGTLTARLDTGE